MKSSIDTEAGTVTLICTVGEVANMEAGLYSVYATPNTQGEANQVYLANRANFKYDFLLADADDFLAAEGWDTVGWDEMTDEEQEEQGKEEITIVVPRRSSVRYDV